MNTAYLGLGSNIRAEQNILSAIEALRQVFSRVELSPAYRCPSFGFEGREFINLVARIETALQPLDLKRYLTRLENDHERARDVPRYSDRTLDVDILLYNDLYLRSPELEIPRDEILEAAYVLRPLAELAPDIVHPVKRRTLRELWAEFPPQGDKLTPVGL